MSGIKQKLHRKPSDCEEIGLQQGFVHYSPKRRDCPGVAAIRQVTTRIQAISAPFWLTPGAKFLSQMNP
jgi:hypothetical protein